MKSIGRLQNTFKERGERERERERERESERKVAKSKNGELSIATPENWHYVI
jgi:hypothetical protein